MLKNWLEQRKIKKAQEAALADQNAKEKQAQQERLLRDKESISKLREMLDETHSPYVQEVLDSKLPIYFFEMPANSMGMLYTDPFNGSPLKMHLNTKYGSVYALARTMVHETFHWKQHTDPGFLKYNAWNFTTPQQAFKVHGLTEMNAIAGELYKLVVDFASSKIDHKEVEIAYLESSGMLFQLVEAHKGDKTKVTNWTLFDELQKIKSNGKVKPAEEVYPEFYYKISQVADYKEIFINDYFVAQKNRFGNLAEHPEMAAIIMKEMKQESKAIESGFTAADVDTVLGWDGSQPMRKLDAKKQKEFLYNISTLDKSQRQQIESFKQQANSYLL